ncbi:MAG TPA: hypothetical protein VFZ13_15290, partial [Gemmatimonadales bacterium]
PLLSWFESRRPSNGGTRRAAVDEPDADRPVGMERAGFLHCHARGAPPNGAMLHEIMPWKQFRNMTDEELEALWQYLRSVPAQPPGER